MNCSRDTDSQFAMPSIPERTSSSICRSYCRKVLYKTLLDRLFTMEDKTSNKMELMDKTSAIVDEANTLFNEVDVEEKAKHLGEGVLDSRVMRVSSDMALRFSDAITGNVNVYNKHELAQHIREHPEMWQFMFPQEVSLASHLVSSLRDRPALRVLEPRAFRRRIERRIEHRAARVQPARVSSLEQNKEGVDMVNQVRGYIARTYRESGEPLSYFHTVLDPTSFSKTVENIYYISFLVRDGVIAVQLDKKFELPFITPVSESGHGSKRTEENQFIVSIDMQRWQELINIFDIQSPTMVLEDENAQ